VFRLVKNTSYKGVTALDSGIERGLGTLSRCIKWVRANLMLGDRGGGGQACHVWGKGGESGNTGGPFMLRKTEISPED